MTENNEAPEPFPSGTVLRWTAWGKYQFAALLCDNDLWYITGGADTYETSMKTPEGLFQLLDDPKNEITNIEYSTGWAAA